MTWSVGDDIVLQEVWRDRLWAARPLRVVDDTDERLILWCPKGTMRKVPTTPPTRPRASQRAERVTECMAHGDWVLVDSEWDVSTLWFLWPNEWHAVWVSWFEPGVHWGWYGNLQTPYRRTRRGLVTMDLMLDVLIQSDGRWQWKDVDDFDAMIRKDLIDDATAQRVRDAGDAVLAKHAAGTAPFCDPWPAWTPDPAWPAPVLRNDWYAMD